MTTEYVKLYGHRHDVTLTTYVLDDSPEMLFGRKRPAVLVCPGGAYLGCSDREAEPVALRFASMGYHAFVLRYSTYGEGHDFSQPLTPKSHCQYPMPMVDIDAALRMIVSNADRWYVDTDRIALCGFSAGAHNAAMYATNWHKDRFGKLLDKRTQKVRPATVLLGYAVTDYVLLKKNAKETKYKDLYAAFNTAYLGESVIPAEIAETVSPARNVTEHTPPMFLWTTAQDSLVPAQHTAHMAIALADQNIPFEMHIFESGEHGLSLATQASAGQQLHMDENAAEWSSLAEKWLLKRFALPIES